MICLGNLGGRHRACRVSISLGDVNLLHADVIHLVGHSLKRLLALNIEALVGNLNVILSYSFWDFINSVIYLSILQLGALDVGTLFGDLNVVLSYYF